MVRQCASVRGTAWPPRGQREDLALAPALGRPQRTRHRSDVIIVPLGAFLFDAAHFLNNRVLMHGYSSINSSGVQIIGEAYPLSSSTENLVTPYSLPFARRKATILSPCSQHQSANSAFVNWQSNKVNCPVDSRQIVGRYRLVSARVHRQAGRLPRLGFAIGRPLPGEFLHDLSLYIASCFLIIRPGENA